MRITCFPCCIRAACIRRFGETRHVADTDIAFCRWSPSMASRWLLAEPVLVLDSNMSEVVAVTGGPTRQESVTHIKRHKLANCNVPLVHGRPNPSISPRSRLSTHQRNHSLDFRYIFISAASLTSRLPLPEYPRSTLRHARELFASRDASVSWHLLNKRSPDIFT